MNFIFWIKLYFRDLFRLLVFIYLRRVIPIPVIYCLVFQRWKLLLLSIVFNCSACFWIRSIFKSVSFCCVSRLIIFEDEIRGFVSFKLLLNVSARATLDCNFWQRVFVFHFDTLKLVNSIIIFNVKINIRSIKLLLCFMNHIVSKFYLILQVLDVIVLKLQSHIFSLFLLLKIKFLDFVHTVLIAKRQNIKLNLS